MKTFTIKREMIESLESDEDKLAFIDHVAALLTDRKPKIVTAGVAGEIFQDGLNVDLPEPLEGSPEFDSSNMGAAEYRRYSLVRAGFFPIDLNCGYADYKYKHIDDCMEENLMDMFVDIGTKSRRSKGKRDYAAFLKYMQDVLLWHKRQKIKTVATMM